MTDKVKLFLGAYVNSKNAQNLNCLALAKYLDKTQFDKYDQTRKIEKTLFEFEIIVSF